MRQRRRGENGYQRIGDNNRNNGPMNKEVLDDLPTVEYTPGMMDNVDATCGICLSEYKKGDMLKYLPCHHHFHVECIDTWLISNKACPYCKHPADSPMDPAVLSHYHSQPNFNPNPEKEEKQNNNEQ